MIATKSISAAFAEDHDRLDRLFFEYCQSKNTDHAAAKYAFVEFKFGLQRHIVWEESILFPRFEDKTGMHDVGPTAVMRAEHRRIADCLEAIHKLVQQHNPNSEREEQALLDALAAHNHKEEQVLYPALDRMLSDEEKSAVFAEMADTPESAYKVCCGRPA
jgi:iron-sulfur cluster repair protein YtfE (RIC family)